MDHSRNERHSYTGTRQQADRLIAELMGRGYWLEASYSSDEWTVVCGLAPNELDVMRHAEKIETAPKARRQTVTR